MELVEKLCKNSSGQRRENFGNAKQCTVKAATVEKRNGTRLVDSHENTHFFVKGKVAKPQS